MTTVSEGISHFSRWQICQFDIADIYEIVEWLYGQEVMGSNSTLLLIFAEIILAYLVKSDKLEIGSIKFNY